MSTFLGLLNLIIKCKSSLIYVEEAELEKLSHFPMTVFTSVYEVSFLLSIIPWDMCSYMYSKVFMSGFE